MKTKRRKLMRKKLRQLTEWLDTMIANSFAVVQAWEEGDLAETVNLLRTDAEQIKDELSFMRSVSKKELCLALTEISEARDYIAEHGKNPHYFGKDQQFDDWVADKIDDLIKGKKY